MKVLMIGTGGIGGYYGYKLHASGTSLVFTARGTHLQKLKESGLTITYENQVNRTQIDARSHQEVMNDFDGDEFDLIILTLKSNATADFIKEFGDWLSRSQVHVMSLQNGVDNENQLAKYLGESRVIGGLAVRIGSHIAEPGHIEATGRAEIIAGIWPRATASEDKRHVTLRKLSKALDAASIPYKISNYIQHELWRKLVINNAVNPLSALTGLDTFQLTHRQEFSKIVHCLMKETQGAATADEVALEDSDIDEMFDLIKSFNPIKTSMLIDKERGRPLEIESIVDAIINRGAKLGIETPYNQLISALLRFNETRKLD